MRFFIHMTLHLAVPGFVAFAWLWSRQTLWPTARSTAQHNAPTVPSPWRLWGIMVATMAVDLDHLLADPIFDPSRCSLGHHPLHTWPAIVVYGLMTLSPRWRWWGFGLLIHMALDGIDCGLMK